MPLLSPRKIENAYYCGVIGDFSAKLGKANIDNRRDRENSELPRKEEKL